MFYRVINSETYKHICKGNKVQDPNNIPIYRHDVKNYISIYNEETHKHNFINVKICPCCLVELDKDEISKNIQVYS